LTVSSKQIFQSAALGSLSVLKALD
jgi:hypothetical protein